MLSILPFIDEVQKSGHTTTLFARIEAQSWSFMQFSNFPIRIFKKVSSTLLHEDHIPIIRFELSYTVFEKVYMENSLSARVTIVEPFLKVL